MRAVIQRVDYAKLNIDNKLYSEIDKGYLVFIAISEDDDEKDLEYITRKTLGLRVFEDDDNKMNLSIKDVDGDIMIVSQFTLLGDVRKGNRPNFMKSASEDKARLYYEKYIENIKKEIKNVSTGIFGEDMHIELKNMGPVTIQLDSKKLY